MLPADSAVTSEIPSRFDPSAWEARDQFRHAAYYELGVAAEVQSGWEVCRSLSLRAVDQPGWEENMVRTITSVREIGWMLQPDDWLRNRSKC